MGYNNPFLENKVIKIMKGKWYEKSLTLIKN
jgi:hypothetical protein